MLKNLKVFECHAFVTVPKEKLRKFDARSVRCRFLGCSEHEKAYRSKEADSNRVLVSRDAKFTEDTFDSGRRDRRNNEVVVQDDDEATRLDSPQHDETDREHEESAQEEEIEPGRKRQQTKQSLKKLTECQAPSDTVLINRPKKCQPQLKNSRLRTLWIQW